MQMRKLLSRREELWGELSHLSLPESTSSNPLLSNAGNGQQQCSHVSESGAHLGEGHEVEMNDEDQRQYLVRDWASLIVKPSRRTAVMAAAAP